MRANLSLREVSILSQLTKLLNVAYMMILIVAGSQLLILPATGTELQVADARQDAALQLFQEGLSLYKSGDVEGAIDRYEMGLNLDPKLE